MGTGAIAEWQGFFSFVGLVAGSLTGLIQAWALLVAALPQAHREPAAGQEVP